MSESSWGLRSELDFIRKLKPEHLEGYREGLKKRECFKGLNVYKMFALIDKRLEIERQKASDRES